MTEDWIHYFDKAKFKIIPSFVGDDNDRLCQNIVSFQEQTSIDWSTVDVAIIGITDSRNSMHKGCDNAPNHVRPYLYGLRSLSKNLNIVDLGNLLGKTIDDRYKALEEICTELLNLSVIPLVIGGGQDYTLPLAKALKHIIPDYRLAIVDSKIDWLPHNMDFSAQNYLGYLCDDENNAPRDLSIVGVQKYLFSQFQEDKIKNASFDFLRLGQIRQNGQQNIEPYMRDADIISVDMTAVRQCDLPGHHIPMPNGLSGEELCQSMWYAGLSDKLKAIGLFELDTLLDINKQGTVLQAQCIWHILEGLALRYKDYPVKELDEYRQFIVHLDDYELDMKFYNNPENDRWWVEIPTQDEKSEIVACGKSDFDTASNSEIPERWFRFIKKKTTK